MAFLSEIAIKQVRMEGELTIRKFRLVRQEGLRQVRTTRTRRTRGATLDTSRHGHGSFHCKPGEAARMKPN